VAENLATAHAVSRYGMKKAKKAAAKKPTQAGAVPEIDPRFAPVASAFARNRSVTAGTLMSSYGLKINGKIFAMSVRGELVVKLPKQKVDALVSNGIGKRFDPGHGRLMKEWVVVGARHANWVTLAKEAYQFVKRAAR